MIDPSDSTGMAVSNKSRTFDDPEAARAQVVADVTELLDKYSGPRFVRRAELAEQVGNDEGRITVTEVVLVYDAGALGVRRADESDREYAARISELARVIESTAYSHAREENPDIVFWVTFHDYSGESPLPTSNDPTVRQEEEGVVQRKAISSDAPSVQRLCAECEEELNEDTTGEVRAKAESNGSLTQSSSLHSTVASASTGTPLSSTVRDHVEPVLGADLSGVRVHADAQSQQANREINAKAFTHKNDIFLGAGQSPSDIQLMAHEATHVVQQGHASGSDEMIQRQQYSMPAANGKVVVHAVPPVIRVYYLEGTQQHGLAEIYPPPGATVDPNLIQVLIAGVNDKGVPIVSVQLPRAWRGTQNKRNDVSLTNVPADNPHEYNARQAELDQLRTVYMQFLNDSDYHYDAMGSAGLSIFNPYDARALTDEAIVDALKSDYFNKWLRDKAAEYQYKRILAENEALVRHYNLPGLTGAQARQMWEEQHGPSQQLTEWEQTHLDKGKYYEKLRDKKTGLTYAYIDRHYYGSHRELESKDIYLRNRTGQVVGGSEAPVKAVYAPWDYFLDPLGLQDMMGIAESNPIAEIVVDLASGGARALLRKGSEILSEGLGAAKKVAKPSVGVVEDLAPVSPTSLGKQTPGAGAVDEVAGISAHSDDLLQESGKAIYKDHLPPALKEAEVDFVRRNLDRAKPAQKFADNYSVEVDLGNGHVWRRQKGKNTWCRFSNPSHCGTSIGPEQPTSWPSSYKVNTNYRTVDQMPRDTTGNLEPLKPGTVYEFDGGHRVWRDPDGATRHESILGDTVGSRAGHEKEFYGAGEHGHEAVKGMERAHSLGQITGWESPYGIYYAPSKVNQTLQKNGIESFLVQLNKSLPADDAVSIATRTVPHHGTLKLKEIVYRIELKSGAGKSGLLFEYKINVASSKLPNPAVTDVVTGIGDKGLLKQIVEGISGGQNFKDKLLPFLE